MRDLQNIEHAILEIRDGKRNFYHGPYSEIKFAWLPTKLSNGQRIWFDEYVILRVGYRSIKGSGSITASLNLDEHGKFMEKFVNFKSKKVVHLKLVKDT